MSLSTIYPSVEPSLNLNFIRNNRLDPRITYTRSTTATYVGSDGYIKTAAINEPRFEYDPVTLAPLGILLEGPRTNLFTYSEQFDNAAWQKTNSAVIENTAIAPDGTLTADKLNETAVTNYFALTTNPTGIFSTAYTWSCYAKAGERNFMFINFTVSGAIGTWDLTTGAVSFAGGVATAVYVGNGWWRCSVTFTTPASGANILYNIFGPSSTSGTGSYAGTVDYGIYIWGAQLEEAFFASSYIPTTSATVTRLEDDMAITGNNFTPWYNQANSAFVISSDTYKADNTANTTISRVFNVSDGSATDRNTLYFNSSGGVSIAFGSGTSDIYNNDSGVASKTFQKIGVNVQEGNSFMTHNGVQVGNTVTDAIIFTRMDEITFFRYGTDPEISYGWGHIQYFLYYPEPLTIAQLKELTKK